MRTRTLSLSLFVTFSTAVLAAPPAPPGDFAQPQSATKPLPFPIKYVDQGQFDPQLKGYQTPEGFKLEIVATDPTIVNPVGMTFTPEGTLFVLEWKPDPFSDGRWFEFKETFRYRDGTTKQVATMKKFVGDPLKELTFNPKTGLYDAVKVVIVDELPSTVLYHDGWMYLTGRGTVRRYKQSKAGGLWDIKETIAQGFCGFHHHQVSGLTIGNDGKLYITSGDDDNFVEGSDGSRANVLRSGAVFRCNLDGSQMETYSLGYRNPYRDIAHDENFNWFHIDNDNEDGSKFTGCRIMHVAEESDYGWRLKIGARCCQPDHLRGAIAGELPGKLPPMLKTGRGSPAGMLIYNDTRLPKQYRGLFFYPDVFRKTIRAYQPKPNGSTFEIAAEFEFIKSEDPLFRPCQMITGPDGAIYICDWRTDSGGAGRLWGDGKNGRIYRLRWVGTKEQPEIPLRGLDSWAKLTKASDDELIANLAADDFSDRVVARNELIRRGERVRAPILKRLISGKIEPAGRLVALGVLQSFWNADVEDLFRLYVQHESADIRRIAVEGLGLRGTRGSQSVQDSLVRAMYDEQPAVRRAATLAVPRIGGAATADALVRGWKTNDGKDVFLTDAYLRALERLGKPGIDALVKLATTGDNVTRDRLVTAFTGLRTKPAADALMQLVSLPNFTPGQQAELVRSYTNYLFDPLLPLEPLAVHFANAPNVSAPVLMAVVEVLSSNGSLASPSGTKLVQAMLDSTSLDVRMSAYQAIEDSRLKTVTAKLVAVAANIKAEAPERTAAIKAIRATGDSSQLSTIRMILSNKVEPPTVRAEALRTVAEFDKPNARKQAEELLGEKEGPLLTEAITTLAATRDGAKLLGEQFLAKKIPAQLWPRISEALRKFPNDPAIAKLKSEVEKGGLLLSMTPADVTKVREMVQTKGNPIRGREVYLNTAKLACATCHRLEGLGGQIGPDLTRVWDTQSIDKLLESIALPSKEIKEGYQSYRVDTLAGQVHTGLKISDTATEVVIREATGRDVRIKKSDLEKIVASGVSLMPDDVVKQLSNEQFIDLLAFLKNREAQESLRGMAFEFAIASGFDPDLKKANALEANPDIKTKPTQSSNWQIQPIEPTGLVSLKPMLPTKLSASYAMTYVYSPKKQKVSAVLQTDEPVRIWVGKQMTFERTMANTEAVGKFDVELPLGWSPVLIKLVNSGSQHVLGLRFVAEGVRFSTTPE